MSVSSDFDDESLSDVVRFLTLLGKNSDQIGADLRRVLGKLAPDKDNLELISAAIKNGKTARITRAGTVSSDSDSESDGEEETYAFERAVLADMVMSDPNVTHSAIIDLDDARLRAAAPKGFRPHKKACRNITDALKGDISGVAENGIFFGSGTKKIIPAKIDPGTFIYGSDGRGGGCSICKSKVSLLILVYKSGPSHVTRMAREIAEFMEDKGH